MAKKGTRRKAKKKRAIKQYEHKGRTRPNNPPVGLVSPQTDKDAGKKTWRYDPHIDPALQFDGQGAAVEKIITDGLAAASVESDDPKELKAALKAAKKTLAELEKRRAPYLNWAGKAERTNFDVDTVSLHVHERIDPRTIIEAVRKRNGNGHDQQRMLFERPEENPPLRQAIEFYKHPHGWTNRLVAGDSLLVMNSLLEKEGMAGKVQMVYIDPPYGIRYGSNFQPFVNRRDVKDGKDEDLTQQPEMLKAFRDTWELGIHSYLTYLRDQLLLARELLHESGSVFVQISDENLHHVRELMHETFGGGNFVSVITFSKSTGLGAKLLPRRSDYIVWYAKQIDQIKYRQLYQDKSVEAGALSSFSHVLLPGGSTRRITARDRANPEAIPNGARFLRYDNLIKPGPGSRYELTLDGRTYTCGSGWWGVPRESMTKLIACGRVVPQGNVLRAVRYMDDFPAYVLQNVWDDTGSTASEKVYVVQTETKVIQRSVLMTTDPGDLVYDPTCGSGTTAFVAEQLGRRWITSDTSRVAITLAKQRLMTAAFDYFKLAHPSEGVGSGFVYKAVPRITLSSIANNPEIREGMTRVEIDAAIAKYADQETLYDQPEIDKTKTRVTGPFTVEAVPAPAVRPVETIIEARPVILEPQQRLPGVPDPDRQGKLAMTADASITRFGETRRQAEWRDELLKTGIRGKGGQRIEFSRVEPLGGTRWLHADAETKDPHPDPLPEGEGAGVQRAVVSFGPEHAPLEQRQVELALEEARSLKPTPELVIFAAFHFDSEAAKDIDETNWPGITLLKAQMNADLLTDDLKKKRASNESYWLIGQPDVELRPAADGKYEVEIHGFDYYDTRSGELKSGDTSNIALWLLDTDYDGRSLYPRQVFFPMAGEKDGWARLARNLKAEIDEELIEQYRGTVSLPFAPGEHRRVAVKIVDDRGIESLKIEDVE